MTRKEELLNELNEIKSKEVLEQVEKNTELMGSAQVIEARTQAACDRAHAKAEANTHRFVIKGDFLLKLLIAIATSAAFVYIVINGTVNASEQEYGLVSNNSDFQLLSVVGPLFGMILQYYFGKNKAGTNGE